MKVVANAQRKRWSMEDQDMTLVGFNQHVQAKKILKSDIDSWRWIDGTNFEGYDLLIQIEMGVFQENYDWTGRQVVAWIFYFFKYFINRLWPVKK